MSNVVESKQELNMLQRFVNMVNKEVSSVGGGAVMPLTDHQKRLGQSYFMVIDSVLGQAEEKRMKKSEKYREALAYTWNNVDLELLARDVVSACRLGLDPAQSNHIFPIPYKNGHTNKYHMVFLKGYKGLELIAKKYALEPPKAIITELVYEKDSFRMVKKDSSHAFESYEFEIGDPFDRGEIRGGFYYLDYGQADPRNKVVVMTLADILKRKPAKASPEFWGGEKAVYTNGKPSGKETVEGWFAEMCLKTIKRAAYNSLTIDTSKIDADYMNLKAAESDFLDSEVAREVEINANVETIDIDPTPAEEPKQIDNKSLFMDPVTGEVVAEGTEGAVDMFAAPDSNA